MSRTPIALALVVVGVVAAPLGAAASGTPTDPSPSKQEVHALVVRGEALNRIYGTSSSTGPTRQEIRAYSERGQALNRLYQVGPSKDEVRALTLRGEAMNRIYHGGQYATTASSFPWRNVELAAVAALAAILLAFAAAIGVRKRRTVIPV